MTRRIILTLAALFTITSAASAEITVTIGAHNHAYPAPGYYYCAQHGAYCNHAPVRYNTGYVYTPAPVVRPYYGRRPVVIKKVVFPARRIHHRKHHHRHHH